MLRGYEAEAAVVLSTAERGAIEVCRAADTKAHHIRADLPQVLAQSRSPGGRPDAHESTAERQRLTERSEREIERLRSAAAVRIPVLVDAAIELIWSSFAIEPDIEG